MITLLWAVCLSGLVLHGADCQAESDISGTGFDARDGVSNVILGKEDDVSNVIPGKEFDVITSTNSDGGDVSNVMPGRDDVNNVILGKEDDVSRVVLGKNAFEGEYQSIVFLASGTSFCGGTLINESWVLTAAHCFKPKDKIYANVGLYSRPEPYDWYHVDALIQHPGFNPVTLANDIALARLFRPVTWAKPLPLAKQHSRSFESELCTVIGWGRTNASSSRHARYLQRYTNWVTPKRTCKLIYRQRYRSSQICLNGPGSSCKGDSGGPLLCDGLVAGVTSYSHKNCLYYPSAYTRVSTYYKWIQKTMKLHIPVPEKMHIPMSEKMHIPVTEKLHIPEPKSTPGSQVSTRQRSAFKAKRRHAMFRGRQPHGNRKALWRSKNRDRSDEYKIRDRLAFKTPHRYESIRRRGGTVALIIMKKTIHRNRVGKKECGAIDEEENEKAKDKKELKRKSDDTEEKKRTPDSKKIGEDNIEDDSDPNNKTEVEDKQKDLNNNENKDETDEGIETGRNKTDEVHKVDKDKHDEGNDPEKRDTEKETDNDKVKDKGAADDDGEDKGDEEGPDDIDEEQEQVPEDYEEYDKEALSIDPR